MTEVACIGQHQLCVGRATRLDDDCSPLTGPTDGIVFAAIATSTYTPEVKERTYLEPEDACGNIVFVAETPEVVKRGALTLELVATGFEAVELLSNATLILGGASSPWVGDTIGVEHPGINSVQKPGVGLELWVRSTAVGSSGPCGPEETNPKWVRHVFPRALLRVDARTFNAEVGNVTFTGIVTANSEWGDPYDDYPGATAPSGLSPHSEFFDVELPEVECGYVGSGS